MYRGLSCNAPQLRSSTTWPECSVGGTFRKPAIYCDLCYAVLRRAHDRHDRAQTDGAYSSRILCSKRIVHGPGGDVTAPAMVLSCGSCIEPPDARCWRKHDRSWRHHVGNWSRGNCPYRESHLVERSRHVCANRTRCACWDINRVKGWFGCSRPIHHSSMRTSSRYCNTHDRNRGSRR